MEQLNVKYMWIIPARSKHCQPTDYTEALNKLCQNEEKQKCILLLRISCIIKNP